MRQSKTPRVLATIFLGVLSGTYRHFRQTQWLARGRDAYLADQSHYFDQILKVHSAITTLIAGIILALVAVAIYEGFALAIEKLIPTTEVEG